MLRGYLRHALSAFTFCYHDASGSGVGLFMRAKKLRYLGACIAAFRPLSLRPRTSALPDMVTIPFDGELFTLQKRMRQLSQPERDDHAVFLRPALLTLFASLRRCWMRSADRIHSMATRVSSDASMKSS